MLWHSIYYDVSKDFSLPLLALGWAFYTWYRDGRRILSIRQVGHQYSDRITSRSDSMTNYSVEMAITNDSPRANIVIAYYSLELPWCDDSIDPLPDPIELDPPSEHYKVHPEPIRVFRGEVLNHRRYQNGKLGPGEAFRGFFLAKGGNPIPKDLQTQKKIEARFVVQDTRGKEYRSRPIYFFPS